MHSRTATRDHPPGGLDALVHAGRISERVGADVWLKIEGANPTGLLQGPGDDVRGVGRGARRRQAVICASTGNTATALRRTPARRAFGRRDRPGGKIATGKLAQALMHGAA
jgi:threonine synthase